MDVVALSVVVTPVGLGLYVPLHPGASLFHCVIAPCLYTGGTRGHLVPHLLRDRHWGIHYPGLVESFSLSGGFIGIQGQLQGKNIQSYNLFSPGMMNN